MAVRRSRAVFIVGVLILAAGAMALLPGTALRGTTAATADASVSVTPPLLTALNKIMPSSESRAPTAAPNAIRQPAPASVEVANVPAAAAVADPAAEAPDVSSSADIPAGFSAGKVGIQAVNVRASPTSGSVVLTVLQAGQDVSVGSTSGGWTSVALADGRTGWVYSPYLTGQGGAPAPARSTIAAAPKTPRVDSADSVQEAVVQGAGGNDLEGRVAHIGSTLIARSGPSNSAPTVGTLSQGDEVRIAEVRGAWLRVMTDDGTSVWIRRAM